MRALYVLPALVILSGCVMQHGTKVDLETVKQFRPGVTTRDQVEAQLGRPTTVVVMNGLTSIGWTWARGTSWGSGESQMVTLTFDAAGVLLAEPTIASSRL